MARNEGSNNNFLWPLGGLQVNAEGQLSEDIRSAVQQFLPSSSSGGSNNNPSNVATEESMISGEPGVAVPGPPPPPGTAAHVVNMGNAPALDLAAGIRAQQQQQQQQQQQLPTLKQLMKGMQGALPFALLLLTKILYDHRLGILVFVGLFGTFYHANSSLKKQISLRESGTLIEWYGSLAWIITFLTANVGFIYYIFDEQQLYKSLYLGIPNVDHLDVWNLFWIVVVNDFIIKFVTVIVKALVALLPKQILPYKKKGKYYLLLENLSQCYRSLVPITPWIYFLQDDQHGGPWFSAILVVLYTICKGGHVYSKYKELRRAFLKFKVDVSYGLPASQSQLDASDNCCPICQDKFSDPVMLTCKHIFCEDCVSLWFDRERTCPMCRANIVDNPQWRDGNTNANLQIY